MLFFFNDKWHPEKTYNIFFLTDNVRIQIKNHRFGLNKKKTAKTFKIQSKLIETSL